jgi:mannose-6-phosphate isomerase-like protein (cupin superfamily)
VTAARQGLREIDLEDGSTLRLSPWDATTIPARTVHRTRAIGRTVNLTVEHLAADTVVVDHPTM